MRIEEARHATYRYSLIQAASLSSCMVQKSALQFTSNLLRFMPSEQRKPMGSMSHHMLVFQSEQTSAATFKVKAWERRISCTSKTAYAPLCKSIARKHSLICEQANCSSLMLANPHVFALKSNAEYNSLVHEKIHELYSLAYGLELHARVRSIDECKLFLEVESSAGRQALSIKKRLSLGLSHEARNLPSHQHIPFCGSWVCTVLALASTPAQQQQRTSKTPRASSIPSIRSDCQL